MSLFPRSFVSNIHEASPTPTSSSFHPLFRLLDDFDNYRTGTTSDTERSTNSNNNNNRSSLFSMKTFTPKFDVRELGEVYELYGDLPGIAQKDIEIEFSDENTLTIKGRTERSYTSSDSPASSTTARLESGKQPQAIKDKDHQPTVEDEDAASASNNTSQEVTRSGENEVGKANENGNPAKKAKYWVSERSVGEFARSFTFPVRVDQDGVKASMKDGVLSIVVPKAKKTEARKILIQ